jgi:hypothetical protein
LHTEVKCKIGEWEDWKGFSVTFKQPTAGKKNSNNKKVFRGWENCMREEKKFSIIMKLIAFAQEWRARTVE